MGNHAVELVHMDILMDNHDTTQSNQPELQPIH